MVAVAVAELGEGAQPGQRMPPQQGFSPSSGGVGDGPTPPRPAAQHGGAKPEDAKAAKLADSSMGGGPGSGGLKFGGGHRHMSVSVGPRQQATEKQGNHYA
nr:unnamed protein product [Digitaria exilis]